MAYDDTLVGIPGEDIGCPVLSLPSEAEGLHYHFLPHSLKTEQLTESEARLVAGKPHQSSHLYHLSALGVIDMHTYTYKR